MKWPNRTAQGFSPGLGARRTRLPVRRSLGKVGRRRKRATEDGACDLTVFPARADVSFTANGKPPTANRQPLTANC
jgi:hypothetical protein